MITFKQFLNEQEEGIDLDRAYELFTASYQEHTGAVWSKDKFMQRASNWKFYGDNSGYIAIRPQRSGLVKLVGVGGSPRSIMKGMKQIMDQHLPIWGMMSKDIVPMAIKMGMIQPPAWIVKGMLKLIPSSVFGDVPFNINNDGSITLQYNDVGDATKYFVGSKEYFKHMIKSIKQNPPASVDMLVIKPLLFAIEKMVK